MIVYDFVETPTWGTTFKFERQVYNYATGTAENITNWTHFRATFKDNAGDGTVLFTLTVGAGLTKSDAANGWLTGTVTPANWTTSALSQRVENRVVMQLQGRDANGEDWPLSTELWVVGPRLADTVP